MDDASVAGSAVVERLTALHPKLIDLSTERVERLLAALGDPHQSLKNVIHVAGTNGKGSTVAFMRAGLEAAGLSVNVYTSPHLVRFGERIRLRSDLVSETQLLAALERCEVANAGHAITFFEILTVAAFLLFADSDADANLIEVGLGGRYDATNVFKAPAATVITPVSIDHVDFLGPDVAKIAWEKAGILKQDRPATIAYQDAEALEVIQCVAVEVGAPLSIGGIDWRVQELPEGFRFECVETSFDLPLPALAGLWQLQNAGLALATLNHLPGVTLTQAVAEATVTQVQWPARLHRLTHGPLVDAAGLSPLWLDGGHNTAAAKALAETIARWPTPPRLIIGMLKTKDAAAYIQAFGVKAIEVVAIPGADASISAEALAAAAQSVGVAATTHSDLKSAVAALSDDAPILIAGSLYLAGVVLKENG
jgi:dihydrofolate synthase/folylpolyglutamate synthase